MPHTGLSLLTAFSRRLLGVDGVSQLQEEHARLSVENEYLRQALGGRGAAVLEEVDLSTLPPYDCCCSGAYTIH